MSKKTEASSMKALIIKEADEVFGSPEKAKKWLNDKNKMLGMTPLEMLKTENGAQEVRKILSAIAYGGVV